MQFSITKIFISQNFKYTPNFRLLFLSNILNVIYIQMRKTFFGASFLPVFLFIFYCPENSLSTTSARLVGPLLTFCTKKNIRWTRYQNASNSLQSYSIMQRNWCNWGWTWKGISVVTPEPENITKIPSRIYCY